MLPGRPFGLALKNIITDCYRDYTKCEIQFKKQVKIYLEERYCIRYVDKTSILTTVVKVTKSIGFAEHIFSIVTKQRDFLQEHNQGLQAVSDFSSIFAFSETKKEINLVPVLPAQRHARKWLLKQKV